MTSPGRGGVGEMGCILYLILPVLYSLLAGLKDDDIPQLKDGHMAQSKANGNAVNKLC